MFTVLCSTLAPLRQGYMKSRLLKIISAKYRLYENLLMNENQEIKGKLLSQLEVRLGCQPNKHTRVSQRVFL